ncbi:MAG: hypothetical protein NZM35_05185 [Chitinophagales bacterium]|nr:hypothetical protein [Chitinophagales bacterium]MDW8418008.1 hypothetical protein [Chitinophagales bacterium]
MLIAWRCGAQPLDEDTTTRQPLIVSKKFKSRFYVGTEAICGQILRNRVAMLTGWNLNWVINHRFVVSARYHILSSRLNISHITQPGSTDVKHYLKHHYAGLSFGYLVFHDSYISLHPELSGGWALARFEDTGAQIRQNHYGMLIPAIHVVCNVSSIFRVGAGVNYRLAIGREFRNIRPTHLGGASGMLFIRIGTF